MRILFVTHRYPPRTGGVETHVQEIATRLVDRGHDVAVFSADAGSDVPQESTDEGVRVRRFQSMSPGGAFYIAPQIAFAVRQSDADLVHAHNYHAFPLFFTALGVTEERFVVTTHYHGVSASGFRDVLLSFYRPFGQWAVRQADEVIAVSEWEQKRLSEDFGVNATVIPNGVEVQRFAEAEPEEHDRPYLLTVGRLARYKGIQHVICAMSEIENFDLLIVGTGPYSGKLKQLSEEKDVGDRVKFLGYVKDSRLKNLYSGASVYVTLSEHESFGMTPAESIAAGTPCVVRKAGALVDWTKQKGCIGVSDTSTDMVASALRGMVGVNPDSSSLYTWSEVTNCVESEYNSVLSSSNGR